MDRKLLQELGLNDEQINSVMAEHGKSLNGLKQEKSSLEAEVENYKSDIADRDNQLEELKKNNTDNAALTQQIEALKQANSDKDAVRNQELANVKKDYEIRLALNSANVRNEIAVRALLDLDKVSFDETGALTGLDEQLTTLKENESYLFNTEQTGTQPKDKVIPPIGGNPKGGNAGQTETGEELGKSNAERLFGKK